MMWIILIILIILVIWLIKVYNRLQASMQTIREQLSNLHAALKKRVDLANQIIDIAQGYTEHEKLTHLSVSKANEAKEHMAALSQAFPQLRANETYQNLMLQLESLEESILSRRERYNASVREYNSYRNSFPAVLVAQKLSFSAAPYFEMDDPDFMEKIKLFERDDTQALQQLMSASGEALTKHTAQARDKIAQEYQRRKQHDEQGTPEASNNSDSLNSNTNDHNEIIVTKPAKNQKTSDISPTPIIEDTHLNDADSQTPDVNVNDQDIKPTPVEDQPIIVDTPPAVDLDINNKDGKEDIGDLDSHQPPNIKDNKDNKNS